jgi:two-component system, NarL family, response regulator DegU
VTVAETDSTVRVVLADDHRMLREGLRRALEEHGIDVLGEANDGAEAVELVEQLRPDVVVMDVTMPVLDGIEATIQLRRQTPTTRVLMLTMHADEDVVARALRAGATGYLTKDCSSEELVDAVRTIAAGETAVSAGLAASMLTEVQRLGQAQAAAEPEPIITRREEEVLQLIADGLSTPEVAAQLYISLKTVKNHLASIYQKLDSRDRTQAVVRAVRMGIIHLE